MKTIQYLLITLFFPAVLSSCSITSTDVSPAPAADIAGTYAVTGFEQDKQQYSLNAGSRITYTLAQVGNEQIQLTVKKYKDGQLTEDTDHGTRTVKRDGSSIELYEGTLLIGEYVDQTLYITFAGYDDNNRQIIRTYSAKRQ